MEREKTRSKSIVAKHKAKMEAKEMEGQDEKIWKRFEEVEK
jgi:hypothetical protein